MCATRVPERVKLARAKRVMEPVAVYDCDCPSQPGVSSTHWWVNQRLGPTVRVALVESANALAQDPLRRLRRPRQPCWNECYAPFRVNLGFRRNQHPARRSFGFAHWWVFAWSRRDHPAPGPNRWVSIVRVANRLRP